MKKFKDQWKLEMREKLAVVENLETYYEEGWTDEDIDSMLDQMYDEYIERVANQVRALLYNNVKDTVKNVKLELMLDFIETNKPITTEHGCLFARHEQVKNKQADLLEFLGESRKIHKKAMLNEKRKGEDADPNVIKFEDTNQKSYKVLANSYYGITGQQSSLFFNKHVALSVTGKGRSIISTALTTFENFLGNDIQFDSMEQLIHYVNIILKEEHRPKLKKYISINKTRKDVVKRLKDKLSFEPSEIEMDMLNGIVKNIKSQHIINKLFYKDNIYELIVNEPIKEMYKKIIFSPNDFYDPNELPEDIEGTLHELWDVITEFGLTKIIIMDKMEKLQTKKRSVVLGVDTDSNFLNIGTMVDFMSKEFDLSPVHDPEVKIINTTAFLLSNVIASIYELYTTNCNVPEKHRWLISMKNEFCWKRVMFTANKKSYASITTLQEGVMIPENKQLDIKGLQIKKSNVNKEVSSYLTNILEFDILKSEKIDNGLIYDKLEQLEETITSSILERRETKFSQPYSVKPASDYKDPFRISQFKASTMWNELVPEDPIVFPTTVNLFKLKGAELSDIEVIKKDFPDMYNRIKERIFEDEVLSKYGLEAIAMPKSVTEIPDWLLPLIDIDTIKKDNISVFTPILNAIGLKTLEISQNNYFSNIIEI